ncbi:MAG TPA: hypothetical protein VLI06_21705 [Solimonas sp.]|nr:hypothetical protein [Solimonas sp.]
MNRKVAALLTGLLLWPFAAVSATPLGPPQQVNQFSTGDQQLPAVAANAAGDIVVAWDSVGQDGSLNGIYARRYGADGLPRGDEFRVNLRSDNRQTAPRVSIDDAGNFVVAWISNSQDQVGIGIYARRFAASGAPLSGEIRVDMPRPSSAHFDLSMNGAGAFVIAWADKQKVGGFNSLDVQTIRAQLFDPAGAARGPSFEAYTGNLIVARAPSVAMNAVGGFVAAWFVGPEGIYANRFDAAGNKLGQAFRVNPLGRSPAVDRPCVALQTDGGFTVVWETLLADFTENGVHARRYDAAARALGPNFRVGTGLLRNPVVACSTDGICTVVAHGNGIRMQSYGVAGNSLGPEQRVDNAASVRVPLFAAVATGATGGLLIAWQQQEAATGREVLLRRYAQP